MGARPNMLFAVYDPSGTRHQMTYANARDLVTHDGWSWKLGQPGALAPANVFKDSGPNLATDDNGNAVLPPAGEDDGEDDSEEDEPSAPSQPEVASGIAYGQWSGLTKQQAVAKALELEIKVDGRWNRQRVIQEIEQAMKAL